MSDDWYDAGQDEYMEMLEDSFSKDQGIEYTRRAMDLYNEIHEEGFNLSLPRAAIIYALTSSAHSTIKKESLGGLEGTLQGLTPPVDSDFWTAGERPDGFVHTLRRMEEPGLVELIWSEGGERQTLLGAKLTELGMAYGLYHGVVTQKDFIEFLALDGEWPPKEEAQFDFRPKGIFDGFTTETAQADLEAAMIGFSSKSLFARRQTVSFNRAYEAVMNHDALVCFQFLPEKNRRHLTRRLLSKVATSGDLQDLAVETIESINGWHNKFKKLKHQTQDVKFEDDHWSDAVDDYVIRVAWLMIKRTTDEQVINPILPPVKDALRLRSKYAAARGTYGGSIKPAN
tara:strand:- start:342 stop:1367 length:1026 start_codon:yes stop_codon:yes gene_type:complete